MTPSQLSSSSQDRNRVSTISQLPMKAPQAWSRSLKITQMLRIVVMMESYLVAMEMLCASCTRWSALRPFARRTSNYFASTVSWASGTKITRSSQYKRLLRSTKPTSAHNKKTRCKFHRSWSQPRTRSRGTCNWWSSKLRIIEVSYPFCTMRYETY